MDKKNTLLYRFTCEKCKTTVNAIMPFRRKPCPVCGGSMVLWSVKNIVNEEKKGGDK